jgi:hypothetical protein
MVQRHLAAAIALLTLASASYAAKVKVWHRESPTHYEKARLKGVVVTSEGSLRLSRQLKSLAAIGAAHVWDVVEDKLGNLYIATGDEGKLYKLAPDGKLSVAYDSGDSQVLCLAQASDGAIYAGTGPRGQIIRVGSDGSARVIHEIPDSYVWCMACDPTAGVLYAGTGPKGRIYRVTAEGKAQVFYTTRQEHVLCMAVAGDGTLYAGTDKNGLVYRFDAKAKGFVLYNAPQAEVKTLLVSADGVYAGTSSPRRRALPANNLSAERSPPAELAAVLTSATKPSEKTKTESGGKSAPGAAQARDRDEKAGPSIVGSAAAGENSLYRIGTDGSVREVFREKALILSLLRQEGRIFIGTGMEGQLFEVDEATRERSEVARLDHGQIHAMCRRRDGSIVLGTGDPGMLYVLQDRYTARGTAVSEVLDARMVSRWGALRWKADTPAGTRVTVAVRSGNVAEPDETWSDWSPEQTDPDLAVVAAPSARFLQYRATLTSDNPAASPSLRSLSLRYATMNQAPEVSSIEVPNLDAGNLDNPKKVHFHWSASDPNDDELSFNLYVRKTGWKHWVELAEGLDRKEFEWDTTTAPAGIYQLKVVASDRKDNSDEDALTGERISASFAVAHEPPQVAVRFVGIQGQQALIEATATDHLVRLTFASFAVNGKKWVNVFPADGLFDSRTETFRFHTGNLKSGTHVLVLQVRDAAGNTGSGDVVFTVPARDHARKSD